MRRLQWRLGTAWRSACAALCLVVSSSAASEPGPIPDRLLPLARELELQFHLSYDAAPPAYRACIRHTLDVFAAWQRSGRTPQDEALLEGWLHDAIERSLPHRRAVLAPIPAFSDPLPVSTSGATADVPRQDETGGQPTTRRPPQPSTAAPPLSRAPSTLPRKRMSGQDPAARPEPAVVTAPRRPAEPPIVAPPATRPPAPPESAAASTAIPKDPPLDALPSRRPDRTRSMAPTPDDLVVASVADVQSPAAELRIRSGPDEHAPSGSRPSGERSLPHITADLNLDEYAARLVGHRLGIRRLEARLLELRAPTADQLATLVGELEALHNQGSLLAMYARLLPDGWKAAYGAPVSAAEAREMLAGFVHRRQSFIAEEPGSASSHARESALLTMLSATLVRLGETLESPPSN